VVSLRPMFPQFIRDTNTNENNTVTHRVAGRWWLSGEHDEVHTN